MNPRTVQVSTPLVVEFSLTYGINLVSRYGILLGMKFRKISKPFLIMVLLLLEALTRILGVHRLRSGVRIRAIWAAISMIILWFLIRHYVVTGLVLHIVARVVLVPANKQWLIRPISRVSTRRLFYIHQKLT